MLEPEKPKKNNEVYHWCSLCPIKAGADPRLLLSLMQGEYMPRGTRYSVTRTVIYSTMMAIRLTETDTGRRFTVRICTLCDVRCIRVVQKKYIYFGYWKYTKNSSLPLILIRKDMQGYWPRLTESLKLHHLCVDMEQLPDKWEWRTLNVTVVLQYQYYIGIWKTFDSNMPEKIKVQSSTPCSINLSEQMRATMERIKVTDMPIYQKRYHQFSDSDFSCYIQVHLNKLECRGKVHLFQ